MASRNDSVPTEIETILIDGVEAAGAIGGAVGGAAGGGGAGMSGGARGGARGARAAGRRQRTTIEERPVRVTTPPETALARCRGALPGLVEFASPADHVRFVVPVGRTGIQRVVVDIDCGRAGTVVRAYAKEGLITRHPAARVADQVSSALVGDELPA